MREQEWHNVSAIMSVQRKLGDEFNIFVATFPNEQRRGNILAGSRHKFLGSYLLIIIRACSNLFAVQPLWKHYLYGSIEMNSTNATSFGSLASHHSRDIYCTSQLIYFLPFVTHWLRQKNLIFHLFLIKVKYRMKRWIKLWRHLAEGPLFKSNLCSYTKLTHVCFNI